MYIHPSTGLSAEEPSVSTKELCISKKETCISKSLFSRKRALWIDVAFMAS